MEDFAFEPQILTIAPGDTVIWTAVAPEHTVTSDETFIPNPSVPTDCSPHLRFLECRRNFDDADRIHLHGHFQSGRTFPYYCRIHGNPGTFDVAVTNGNGTPVMGNMPMSTGDNMVGMIRVQVPSENHPPATPTNSTPVAGATDVSSSPVLKSSAFSDPDEGDHHVASQWLLKLAATGEVLNDSGVDSDNLVSITFADLLPNTQYIWQVRYRDDRGLWSEYSAETSFTTFANTPPEFTGLNGTYSAYNLKKDSKTKSVERVDEIINFDWGMGRPHPSISPNNFHIVWKGKVTPQYTERYLFRVKADSGGAPQDQGQTIIDDWIVSRIPLVPQRLC